MLDYCFTGKIVDLSKRGDRKMKTNNVLKKFRGITNINCLLTRSFKYIPFGLNNDGLKKFNNNDNILKFFQSFALVVFILGVFTQIVQAESKEEIQAIAITKFRSTSENIFPKTSINDMLKQHDFFCKEYGWSKGYSNPDGSGFHNEFEEQKDGKVIYDYASGLMWQKSGSYKQMDYDEAKAYVDQLNNNRFAGYNDWRLPTLEEAMSLMEPTENNDRLYIDSLFDKTQMWILTSDLFSPSNTWFVDFSSGSYYYCNEIDPTSSYVRAVR